MRVSLVEYAIARYPEGMEGWHCYRIEYGGHAESCITEGVIWLPPNIHPDYIESILRKGRDYEQAQPN